MQLRTFTCWSSLTVSALALANIKTGRPAFDEPPPTATPCIMPKSPSDSGDDTPLIAAAIQKCGNHSTYEFTAGRPYNLLTPLAILYADDVKFLFKGNVSFNDNIEEVQIIVADTEGQYKYGHWISVTGTDVAFEASGDGGWFFGHGEKWWPKPNQDGRPHAFSFRVDGLVMKSIKVLNPVGWTFSIGGSNVYMRDIFVDARSSRYFPFNTDGIDCSASNVLIDGIEVHNGDDLINVAPPATNVTVRNIIASGSHGVTVSCGGGSGGGYLFENAQIFNSLMGARFKGQLGKTCDVHDVTWKNFEIQNTAYPIHFIGDYVDQERKPSGATGDLAAVARNFRWEAITGTTAKVLKDGSCISDPCWSATLGESTQKGLYLLCKDKEHCQDFKFSGIDLKTAVGQPAEMECTGLIGVEDMGIPCSNGTIGT